MTLARTATILSNGTIINQGKFMLNGTIANGGSFTDICQGSVNSVSGNAPTTSACTTPTVKTPSGQTFDVANPTINGTPDANAVIKLTEGSVTVGQPTADSTGNWTIIVSPLAQGAHALTAEAFGPGGNSGSASIGLTIAPGAAATSTSSTPTNSVTTAPSTSSLTSTVTSESSSSSTTLAGTTSQSSTTSTGIGPTTTTSTSGGGGVPMFPYQLGIAAVFTALLVASYQLIRNRTRPLMMEGRM